MRHIELFSGIGGFRQAMALLEQDHGVSFECVGYSEIDSRAKETYRTNFHVNGEVDMGDIVAFNARHSEFYLDQEIDLLTGGFPCQPFSMMGQQRGFEDQRGQLFFQIHHILKLKQEQGHPIPFVLLENVRNLLTHDKRRTFAMIKGMLEELGYRVYVDVFNAQYFKQAQKRNRVLIFALHRHYAGDFCFSFQEIVNVFNEQYEGGWSIENQPTVLSVLDREVDKKYYLSEKIKPTILSDGSANFKSKSEINQIIARPLTATMHKMHRACQDNYYSDDFILSTNPLEYIKRDFSKEELRMQAIRKLTPEEAFGLQGFPKDYATRARSRGISNGALYKQAGNAVSVNMIYATLYYVFVCKKLMNRL